MHDFDLPLTFKEKGLYQAPLSQGWSINHTPNGGYLMAVLTRAMGQDISLPDSAIVTANYLDRCEDQPAFIEVETMGESGTFLRRQARLLQAGKERVRAMATFVKKGRSQACERFYDSGPESVAPLADCIPMSAMVGYSLFDNIDLRLDPVCAGWMRGELTDRSVMKGWVRFKEARPVDLLALTLFADVFPPCIFASRGMVAWVPTVELTVNVRQPPKTPWVKGIFSTRFLSQGLVEEDGELWDQAGNLLALSRQIAKFSLSC